MKLSALIWIVTLILSLGTAGFEEPRSPVIEDTSAEWENSAGERTASATRTVKRRDRRSRRQDIGPQLELFQPAGFHLALASHDLYPRTTPATPILLRTAQQTLVVFRI